MKKIILSNGKWTLVSDEDFLYLVGFKWWLNDNNKGKGYVCGRINGKYIFMHKIIAERMKLDLSNDIDHIDRNKLNNQRENLRAATRSQNSINSEKQKNNTSGFKGVSWDKENKKWVAQIKANGKHINLGRFDDVEEAAQAYQEAALKYHKEFANF